MFAVGNYTDVVYAVPCTKGNQVLKAGETIENWHVVKALMTLMETALSQVDLLRN